MDVAIARLEPSSLSRVRCVGYGPRGTADSERVVPEETAVAFVYDGSATAVMMATPADLADFALGFSLTEGIVQRPGEVVDLTIHAGCDGIELRMWLAAGCAETFRGRSRRFAGPTGCGLCGIESLAEAARPTRTVTHDALFSPEEIDAAVMAVESRQQLQHITRATHAAGFYSPREGLVAVREDVGRHNALDKLAGALARNNVSADGGAVVITSRVSVEMVQKAAVIGAPILIAISAPTALAVRTAEASGITLVVVARGASFEICTHARRIQTRGSGGSAMRSSAAC